MDLSEHTIATSQSIRLTPASNSPSAEDEVPVRKRRKTSTTTSVASVCAGTDDVDEAEESESKTAPRKQTVKKSRKVPNSSQSQSSGGAAASSTSMPAHRFSCDSNSLSLILSFLNLRDFKSSTQVSQQWKAASSTHTAWPKQSIDQLILSLQKGIHGRSDVRRLRIRQIKYTKGGLGHLLGSRSYSKVNDILFPIPQTFGVRLTINSTISASRCSGLPNFRTCRH